MHGTEAPSPWIQRWSHLLAHACTALDVACGGGRHMQWLAGQGHAVLGTYTRGGTVFTCGSTDWSHGLRGRDPIVERITRNILDRLGK